MPKFKRSQAKYIKKPYKISNWREYEKSLVQRGSLTVWISDGGGAKIAARSRRTDSFAVSTLCRDSE